MPTPTEIQLAARLASIERTLSVLLNWRTDGTLRVQRGASGMYATVPPKPGQWAVITGGTNPYSWRMVHTLRGNYSSAPGAPPQTGNSQAPIDINQAGIDGAIIATTSQFPAFEQNGRRDVLPGTIVWMAPRFKNSPTAAVDLEFWFDYTEGRLAAKITTAGAPTTDLAGAINASVTAVVVDSASTFPGHNNFKILVDNEVMLVTAGAGTTSWTVTRASDNTVAASHADEATVTLADSYAWTEEVPPTTGLDLWINQTTPHAGTQTAEPARERNANPFVPDGTYVLLHRKGALGVGSTTLTAAALSTDTTLNITSNSSFPTVFPYYVLVDGEFMKVTAHTSTTMTVVRGQYMSYATQHDLKPMGVANVVAEFICEWVFEYCCRSASGAVNINSYIQYVGAAPSTPINGQLWIVSAGCLFQYQCGGSTYTIATAGGAGGSGTANNLAYWTSANNLGSLGSATNGQIPIGSTGATPVLSTITQGNGITVTNGAGSITVATTGGGGQSGVAGENHGNDVNGTVGTGGKTVFDVVFTNFLNGQATLLNSGGSPSNLNYTFTRKYSDGTTQTNTGALIAGGSVAVNDFFGNALGAAGMVVEAKLVISAVSGTDTYTARWGFDGG